jgi:hypothetical protein
MSDAEPRALAQAQVQSALEFWFSDANLRRDSFLRAKITSGGPEGWVRPLHSAKLSSLATRPMRPNWPHDYDGRTPAPTPSPSCALAFLCKSLSLTCLAVVSLG